MIKLVSPYPEFCLIGIANNFVLGKKGKIKSFELETDQGKYNFKITSKLHKSLNYELHPQIKLEVRGKVDICLKTARIKLKAEKLSIVSANPLPLNWETLQPKTSQQKSQILLCQKSTCWNKGGQEIYEKLTEEIQKQGLQDSVIVKKTGCMGRCKYAPNLTVLPDKTRYQCFKEQDVCKLIDNHCSVAKVI